MFQGFLIGAGTVLVILVVLDVIANLRLRRKNRYLPRKGMAMYIELSRHNNQAEVDRFFGMRK